MNNGSSFKLAYAVFAVGGPLIGGVWFAARNVVFKSDMKEIKIELKSDMADLKEDLKELKCDIRDLKSKINDLSDKKQ